MFFLRWSSLRSKSSRYHPSRTLYKLSLGITVLARLQGVTSLAKPEKPYRIHWTEKSKKPQSLLTKTENRRLNWRKPANHQDTESEKLQFLSAKTEKPSQKFAKSAKPKIPTLPSFWLYTILLMLPSMFWLLERCFWRLRFY